MKTISKKSRRRLIFLGPISIIAILYFFVSLSTYIYKVGDLNKQSKDSSDKLLTLQENEQNLKTEIQKLSDPDYIARYAREKYLYTKDGEYVIRMEENEKEENEETKKEYDYKKLIIPTSISTIFLVVFIITRAKK